MMLDQFFSGSSTNEQKQQISESWPLLTRYFIQVISWGDATVILNVMLKVLGQHTQGSVIAFEMLPNHTRRLEWGRIVCDWRSHR